MTSAVGAVNDYLGFGAFGVLEADGSFVCPRAGTLTFFAVNVVTNTIAVGNLVITIRQSASCNGAFANTALTLSIAAGATGCFSVSGSVAVAQGDRISCQVTIPAGAGALVDLSAGLLYT